MKLRKIQIGIGAVLIITLFLCGCAFNRNPKFDVRPVTGEPIMVKRYPKYPGWFELLFWQTREYRKNTRELSYLLSDDQEKIISQYGQPDYLRRVFFSSRGDRVHEWLYWEKQRVVQFVQGILVWDGQLTDYEKTILLHGRPTDIMLTTTDELNTRKLWIEYRRLFGMRHRYFFFVNDRLVMAKEDI